MVVAAVIILRYEPTSDGAGGVNSLSNKFESRQQRGRASPFPSLILIVHHARFQSTKPENLEKTMPIVLFTEI